ncbi:phosphotransferase family protein [Allokutzneria sp. NRRL B-24872]|uniref:phosphotransferase family protein n=1 Tax=Allokutzneria sp. NRRL B-24872 TaxID=1137961 RepID=UPI0011782CE6|nr:aminoglycoside phosphotransferase family protein [Allokutzneria sp. NRRL B-24872]
MSASTRPAERDARAVLAAACDQVGLDSRDATLVQAVDNSVFRLARTPAFIKVMTNPFLAHRARNSVAAARLLAAAGVPAVRPLFDVPNPVFVDECSVSFWHEEPGSTASPSGGELARRLAQLHRLPTTSPVLLDWDPVAALRSRIGGADAAEPSDIDFLTRRCDEIEAELAELSYELPTAVIHGDAHPGNLIMTPAGSLLCDLDTVAIGPQEWDLVPVAVRQLRFAPRTGWHSEMVAAYGVDVTEWDGFPVLRDLRELDLAAAALRMARRDPLAGLEFRKRLRTLRTARVDERWDVQR